MLVNFLFFVLSFFYFKKNFVYLIPNEKDHITFISNLVSILHTYIIVPSCLLYIFGFQNTDFFIESMNHVRGYTLYDILLVTYYRNRDFKDSWKTMVFHHIVVFYMTLHVDVYHSDFAYGFLCEITAIPLYYCWYLLKTKQENSLNFKVSSIILFILYTIFRIITFTYMSYLNIYDDRLSYFNKSFMISMTGLNYFWYYKLIYKIVK